MGQMGKEREKREQEKGGDEKAGERTVCVCEREGKRRGQRRGGRERENE